jgi:hypothetical protein
MTYQSNSTQSQVWRRSTNVRKRETQTITGILGTQTATLDERQEKGDKTITGVLRTQTATLDERQEKGDTNHRRSTKNTNGDARRTSGKGR